MDIEKEIYDEIAELIQSDSSPVGIDAKKTHIYIIYKLNRIEKRLDALEKKLDNGWAFYKFTIKEIQREYWVHNEELLSS